MNALEARVNQSYYVRVAIIGLFTLGLGALLMLFQHRRWAKIFDDAGVTRRDGQQFRWADLKTIKFVRVRRATTVGEGPLNHIELIFNDGKALIFPLMLENRSEVMSFIGALPGGRPA
jgi:hypothetical protein